MPSGFLLTYAIVIGLAVAVALPLLPIVIAAAAATLIVTAVAFFSLGSLLLLLLAAPGVAAEARPAAGVRPVAAAAAAVRPAPSVAAEARPAAAHWRPPVAGPPARRFHLGPNPFLRGQHRGVDLASHGGAVRAACGGRVVFAGRVAGAGTVSVRCGQWRVSYAPLIRVGVREGERIGAGARLGRSASGIHFGVRREGRRFGYVDPLRFLDAGHAPPPALGRPPASSRARTPDLPRPLAARAHAVSRPTPTLAPWPVWLGLALGLTGLLGAGRLRLPFRRLGGAPCRASSISSSSPTTPSSP